MDAYRATSLQAAPTLSKSFAGRVIVVVGPPCVGKGTQCKRLAQQLGLVHLSTGDIFRYHVQQGTELGLKAKQYLENRSFVPDDIVIDFVNDRLKNVDIETRGCLLDGFPRTPEQATALARVVDVERLLLLDIGDDEVLVKRAQQRRIDAETGDIYHLELYPPASDIGDRLIRRENDDDEQAFRTRLAKYRGHINQILPAFDGKVLKLDGTLSPDMVQARICSGLQDSPVTAAVAKHDVPDDDEWPDEPERQAVVLKPVIQVAPCKDIGDTATECNVAVTIQVPDERMRAPVDICCVIDISGSMQQGATPANADGEQARAAQDSGLNILDIVKHAVKAVVGVLKDDDRMAIVAFDDTAEVVFNLAPMATRAQALLALDGLQPRGRTNLWGGIYAGMEALREREPGVVPRRKTLLVLTDGMPNIAPERGHLQELRLYKESHPDFSFQINTFGFGYNLDSQLLANLAAEGHGTFAFIPDAVIVGTTFVNSVANVLSTMTQNAQLHLMLQNGGAFNGPIVGDHPVTDASWGRVVNLGPLHLGQCRDIVVPMSIPAGSAPYLEAILVCSGSAGGNQASCEASSRKATTDAAIAYHTASTVRVGYEAIALAESAQQSAQAAVAALTSGIAQEIASLTGDAKVERLTALHGDVSGRMSKAFDGKDRFNRWGKHYLRALLRAHQLQMCTNFMDQGLQVYGGSEFKAIRAEGDAAFLSLPLPQPKKAAQQPAARRASAPAATTQTNTYYAGAGGGCFGANSMVVIAQSDGQSVCKAVTSIVAGDQVQVADGLATVLCVVKIARDPRRKLISLSKGLSITGQHPVRVNGDWQRPATLSDATVDHDGYVYNFVLDRCHSLLVGGVECVTWGHNFEGATVGHSYFGSAQVIADLSSAPGWNSGLVHVQNFVRNEKGDVIGLVAVGIHALAEMLKPATGPCPLLLEHNASAIEVY